MKRSVIQAQLDEVYAQIPTIECRGKCWDSCGSIDMSVVEQRRIRDRHGITLPLMRRFVTDDDRLCPALTMLGRCKVYEDRPFICRLWGTVPSMQCNYGCIPEGGLLTERDGVLLLARIHEIGGEHEEARQLRALWQDPATAERSGRALLQMEKQRKLLWEVRRNLAERDGSAIYATPAGLVLRRTEQAE